VLDYHYNGHVLDYHHDSLLDYHRDHVRDYRYDNALRSVAASVCGCQGRSSCVRLPRAARRVCDCQGLLVVCAVAKGRTSCVQCASRSTR
jgi:hypothetical protein